MFVLTKHYLSLQEKKEFEQKFSKEQAALREQLQVRHILPYSNITWLLLFCGLLSTHSPYPGRQKSIPLAKLWVSARLYLTAGALYWIVLLWQQWCCSGKQRSFVLSWFSFPKGSYSDYWNSCFWEVWVADSPWPHPASCTAEIRYVTVSAAQAGGWAVHVKSQAWQLLAGSSQHSLTPLWAAFGTGTAAVIVLPPDGSMLVSWRLRLFCALSALLGLVTTPDRSFLILLKLGFPFPPCLPHSCHVNLGLSQAFYSELHLSTLF